MSNCFFPFRCRAPEKANSSASAVSRHSPKDFAPCQEVIRAAMSYVFSGYFEKGNESGRRIRIKKGRKRKSEIEKCVLGIHPVEELQRCCRTGPAVPD